MKIIDLAQEKVSKSIRAQELAELVNPLVEEAFGDNIVGDCFANQFEDNHDLMSRGPGLGYIQKNSIFAFGFLGHFMQDASGNDIHDYSKRDGSVITVPAKYESQARRYAQLYEKKLGKEVTIRLE
jgi:hypothetical protein